jgi:hypothetical protein
VCVCVCVLHTHMSCCVVQNERVVVMIITV